jgi:hypothetical protein
MSFDGGHCLTTATLPEEAEPVEVLTHLNLLDLGH